MWSLKKVFCFKVPELLHDLWTICQFHYLRPKVNFASVQLNLKPKLKFQLQTQVRNVEILTIDRKLFQVRIPCWTSAWASWIIWRFFLFFFFFFWSICNPSNKCLNKTCCIKWYGFGSSTFLRRSLYKDWHAFFFFRLLDLCSIYDPWGCKVVILTFLFFSWLSSLLLASVPAVRKSSFYPFLRALPQV